MSDSQHRRCVTTTNESGTANGISTPTGMFDRGTFTSCSSRARSIASPHRSHFAPPAMPGLYEPALTTNRRNS